MPHILVTGGAGNIGSALVGRLSEREDTTVVVADNLLTGKLEKLPKDRPNVRFVKCDVNDHDDIAALFYSQRFDFVFHLAAVVGVERTQRHPLWVLRDIKGIQNILQLSKNTGVTRVAFSSSSEVYGEPFEMPQNEETTPLNSRLPYAVVKNLGEAFLTTYRKEFGLNYTIFRFFNTYGPNQSEDFVLPRFVRRAMRNEDICVYGDGSQTRTFCYVDDTVDACVSALFRDMYINEIVNVGGEHEITILDLARTVVRITGSRSKIVHLPPLPEGDMSRRRPDVRKMKKLLDREPVSVEEGIRRLIAHYRATES